VQRLAAVSCTNPLVESVRASSGVDAVEAGVVVTLLINVSSGVGSTSSGATAVISSLSSNISVSSSDGG